MNIEACLGDITTRAPVIAAFGVTRNSISDVKVIIELQNVIPVTDVCTAVHFCFASYFVFNIVYPPSFKNIFLFLERYVYCLKSCVKLPMCVIIVHDNLERVHAS